MRALTIVCAARQGREDHWTFEDLEHARERSNHLPRYRGRALVTSDVPWRRRRRVCPGERIQFRAALARALSMLRKADPKYRHRRSWIRRKAIQQALVELGYLTVASGWVRARKLRRGFLRRCRERRPRPVLRRS